MNINEIPTPISDASEVVQTFRGLPDGHTGRVPLRVARDLERRLTVAREALQAMIKSEDDGEVAMIAIGMPAEEDHPVVSAARKALALTAPKL